MQTAHFLVGVHTVDWGKEALQDDFDKDINPIHKGSSLHDLSTS